MTDIDYGELFGVDAAGAEPEVADPAQAETTETQGVEEQEVAETAVEEIEETEAEGEETEAENTQSPEENAKYAAARRKAEQKIKAKYEKQLQDELKRQREEFEAKLSQVNFESPFTKQPVKSLAELDAYLKERMLKQNKWTEEEYDSFVQNLPEVRAAREAKRQAEEAEQKAVVETQLKEIRAFDPSIKTIKDLQQMENYEEFYGFVQRGNDFVQAYKLANFDKLQASAVAKTKQAAMNAMQSKSHLKATSQRGVGAVTVPDDIKAEYKAMMPGISDDEIQKHYNRYVSGNKK